MSKIDEIESKLIQINDGTFQKMCDLLLFYKGYETVVATGSVIGKEKTRKGLPDSYVPLENGNYAFVEYTTKERLNGGSDFYNKLRKDIEHCFDPKSSILANKITEIILCFTNRLKTGEREELVKLCQQYNPSCKFIHKDIDALKHEIYTTPKVAKDFLSIDIDTGQILSPHSFVQQYEKSKVATPLSNTFFHREEDTNSAINSIEIGNVLVLKGAAGVGKSKLALHVIKKYTEKHKNFQQYCISSREGLSIWDDLKSYLLPDKNYIVLIDDANKSNRNLEHLLYLLNEERTGDLKIIATVRDYALNDILKTLKDYNYSELQINKFTDEEIKIIIQSKEFNIQNLAYIERILHIAKGNVRLAIMAAKIGKDSPLSELNNASAIYDKYFESISNDIDEFQNINLIKSLAIISFFKIISKDNKTLNQQIFKVFEMTENEFWESIYAIHQLGSEIIDLFEDQLVKISDQILTNYVFYKVFIKDKSLSYSIILNNFFDDYNKQIKDSIIPITNSFGYENIKEKIDDELNTKWNHVKDDFNKAIAFLKVFWYFKPSLTLVFVQSEILKMTFTNEEYKYTYETNEFVYDSANPLYDLLVDFSLFDEEFFETSLELIFEFIFRSPTHLPRYIKHVRDSLMYHRNGYRDGYIRQKKLIDFLFDRSKNETDHIKKEVYIKFLFAISENLLKTEFTQHESEGMAIKIYTYTISSSDDIKEIRKKLFEFIFNYKTLYPDDVYHVLDKYTRRGTKYVSELSEFDSALLLDFISNELLVTYMNCKLVHQYLFTLDSYKIKYDESLKNKFTNELYELSEILNQDRLRKKEIELHADFQERKKQELINYCQDFSFNDYIKLLSNYQEIINHEKERNLWSFSESIITILQDLSINNENMFIEVLELIIKQGNKINLYGNRFLSEKLLNNNNNKKLYTLLTQNSYTNDLSWQNSFFEALSLEHVTQYYCEQLILNFEKITYNTHFHRWAYVEKYLIWEPSFIQNILGIFQKKASIANQNIYSKITSILLAKINDKGLSINLGFDFIKNSKKYFNKKSIPLLQEIYMKQSDINYDFDGCELKELVEIDNDFILEYIKLKTHELSFGNNQNSLVFLWEFNNYEEIISKCFNLLLSKEHFFSDAPFMANSIFKPAYLKSEHKEKVFDFVVKLVSKKIDDLNAIKQLFNIIAYSLSDKRVVLLELFLQQNNSFEFFKEICFYIGKERMVYSGSRIPYLEEEIEFWQIVLNMVKKLPNKSTYLNHIQLVEAEIKYCERKIINEKRQEFSEIY